MLNDDVTGQKSNHGRCCETLFDDDDYDDNDVDDDDDDDVATALVKYQIMHRFYGALYSGLEQHGVAKHWGFHCET